MAVLEVPISVAEEVRHAWHDGAYDTLQKWLRDQFPKEYDVSPSAEEWKALLTLCVHASMLTDESRPTRCTVALDRTGALNGLGAPERVQLARPLEATATTLAKVGQATSEAGLIRLGVQSGKLSILGFHTPWLTFDEGGASTKGWAQAVLPRVQIVGPGQLRVWKGQNPVATVGPKGVVEADVTRALGVVLDDFLNEIAVGWTESWNFPEPHAGKIVEETRAMVERYLGGICEGVRSRHHGGAIVILRGEVPPAGQLVVNYEVDERTRETFPWSKVSDFLFNLGQKYVALPHLLGAIVSPEVLKRVIGYPLQEAFFALDATAAAIAALSGVDGALVLDGELRLLGFGAEIRVEQPGLSKCFRMGSGAERIAYDLGDFGTRHRSAFRLVAAFPGTIVVVVSQDGTMRCVRNLEGDVTFADTFG